MLNGLIKKIYVHFGLVSMGDLETAIKWSHGMDKEQLQKAYDIHKNFAKKIPLGRDLKEAYNRGAKAYNLREIMSYEEEYDNPLLPVHKLLLLKLEI